MAQDYEKEALHFLRYGGGRTVTLGEVALDSPVSSYSIHEGWVRRGPDIAAFHRKLEERLSAIYKEGIK